MRDRSQGCEDAAENRGAASCPDAIAQSRVSHRIVRGGDCFRSLREFWCHDWGPRSDFRTERQRWHPLLDGSGLSERGLRVPVRVDAPQRLLRLLRRDALRELHRYGHLQFRKFSAVHRFRRWQEVSILHAGKRVGDCRLRVVAVLEAQNHCSNRATEPEVSLRLHRYDTRLGRRRDRIADRPR